MTETTIYTLNYNLIHKIYLSFKFMYFRNYTELFFNIIMFFHINKMYYLDYYYYFTDSATSNILLFIYFYPFAAQT